MKKGNVTREEEKGGVPFAQSKYLQGKKLRLVTIDLCWPSARFKFYLWILQFQLTISFLFSEVESPNSSYYIQSDLEYRTMIDCAMRLLSMNAKNNQHVITKVTKETFLTYL